MTPTDPDKQPGGKLYEAAVHAAAAVAQKLTDADGPVSFDEEEAATLKVIMLGLQKQLSIAQQTNYAIAAALYRKHLQVVHREQHDDGTYEVDLVRKPDPDEAATRH